MLPLHDRPHLQTVSQKKPFLPHVACVSYYVTAAGDNLSVDSISAPALVHGWACWVWAFAAHQGWWPCTQKPAQRPGLGSGDQGHGNWEDGGSRKGQVGLRKASFCLESERSRRQEIQGPGPVRGQRRQLARVPETWWETYRDANWLFCVTEVQLVRCTTTQVPSWPGAPLHRCLARQVQKSELFYYLQASFSLARGVCFGGKSQAKY